MFFSTWARPGIVLQWAQAANLHVGFPQAPNLTSDRLTARHSLVPCKERERHRRLVFPAKDNFKRRNLHGRGLAITRQSESWRHVKICWGASQSQVVACYTCLAYSCAYYVSSAGLEGFPGQRRRRRRLFVGRRHPECGGGGGGGGWGLIYGECVFYF